MSYFIALRVSCCRDNSPWYVYDNEKIISLPFDQMQLAANELALSMAKKFRGHSFITRIVEAGTRRGFLRKFASNRRCIFETLATNEEVEMFGGLYAEPDEIHPADYDLY